jgi:methionyl-tRNA formyltransferase
MKICVFTDNSYIYEGFCTLLPRFPEHTFDFFYSPWNAAFSPRENFRPLRLREQDAAFYNGYDLFLSLHSKQLFPRELVENHLCINVHPGLNPHNRGWFPQVFSILNGLPAGVTIHKMDAELDHGPILWQEELPIYPQDTSRDVYERILSKEIELLDRHLGDLLAGNYTLTPMAGEGNINYKADFDALCPIDLHEPATYGAVIDRLRALTHAPYQNAYFVDTDGKKVYVGITLRKED